VGTWSTQFADYKYIVLRIIGNAATALALGMHIAQAPMSPAPYSAGGIPPAPGLQQHSATPSINALQPSGATTHEPTIDVKHVARAVVNIAQLPLDVTVLEMNIMQVLIFYCCENGSNNDHWRPGPPICHTLDGARNLTIKALRSLY
jgi:hypothetical protein